MTNLSDNTAPLEKKAKTQKYLFDTDFDYSETSDDVQSITPRQLAAANTEISEKSYKDGYEKGIKDTNESITRMAGDQMFVITSKIDDLIETEKLIIDTFHVQVAQVCELIMSKIMPRLLDQGSCEEVKNIIDNAYTKLPQDKKITIGVHESLVNLVEQHLKTIQKNDDFVAQITVKAKEDFETSDCKISWEGAGIEYYSKSIIQEIREILLRLAGAPIEEEQKIEKNKIQETEEGKA